MTTVTQDSPNSSSNQEVCLSVRERWCTSSDEKRGLFHQLVTKRVRQVSIPFVVIMVGVGSAEGNDSGTIRK